MYLILFVLIIGIFRGLDVGVGDLHFLSKFVHRISEIGDLGNFNDLFLCERSGEFRISNSYEVEEWSCWSQRYALLIHFVLLVTVVGITSRNVSVLRQKSSELVNWDPTL